MERVTKVRATGYEIKGLLVDTEFTRGQTLVNLKAQEVAFIGRFSSSNKVTYQAQVINKDLAEQFPAGKSGYYPKLGVYPKRLGVELEDLGKIDLIIVWKAQG